MKKDDTIKKTIDMLVAVGAAGAAAVIGAGHIMDKLGKKKNVVQNAPLLLLPADAKPYVDRFTKSFYLDEFIGSKRIRDVDAQIFGRIRMPRGKKKHKINIYKKAGLDCKYKKIYKNLTNFNKSQNLNLTDLKT